MTALQIMNLIDSIPDDSLELALQFIAERVEAQRMVDYAEYAQIGLRDEDLLES